MPMFKPVAIAAAVLALAINCGTTVAQQSGPPARGSSEVGNFGDVPFSNPQIVITRAEDRAKWRQLEDKQVKERRDLEDKYDADLKAQRARQATERESMLKGFAK